MNKEEIPKSGDFQTQRMCFFSDSIQQCLCYKLGVNFTGDNCGRFATFNSLIVILLDLIFFASGKSLSNNNVSNTSKIPELDHEDSIFHIKIEFSL